jgi:hypothetical protein
MFEQARQGHPRAALTSPHHVMTKRRFLIEIKDLHA